MNANWNPSQPTIDNYLSICREASQDDNVFSTFKSNEHYTPILEHTWAELGQNHLINIQEHNPYLLTNYPSFWDNDQYGTPRAHEYDFKTCSPTTIQYISVLSNLIDHLGSLKGFTIAEIGAGYGGQAKIITDVFKVQKYFLIDLPEVTLLQDRYIKELKIPNTKTFTHETYPKNGEYDLVISNYALTEVLEPLQSEYVDNILMKSKHGYITCNGPINKIQELKEKHNAKELPDIPGERGSNYILIW